MPLIKCDWCGKLHERKSAKVGNKNYCSRACLGSANAERYRKQRLIPCDNCDVLFEYQGHHKHRNQHFFCSDACYKDFKSKQIYVNCDWCGELILKKRSDVLRSKHNFCDRNCYDDYQSFIANESDNQIVCGCVLYRSLAAMKIGRELSPGEQVHHIDGNHTNNSADNLMVVTKSEHMKIHAGMKRRDKSGCFVKEK